MKTKKSPKKSPTKFKSIPKHIELYCGCLAGVKYADSQLTNINPGASINLVWERSNPFDPNAIRVDLDEVKLGYIKGRDTHILHAHREAGVKLHGFIRSYHPTNPSYTQIVVVVYGDKPTVAKEIEL